MSKITDKRMLDWLQKSKVQIWYGCGCCPIVLEDETAKDIRLALDAEIRRTQRVRKVR
jgi:hypothetical protein